MIGASALLKRKLAKQSYIKTSIIQITNRKLENRVSRSVRSYREGKGVGTALAGRLVCALSRLGVALTFTRVLRIPCGWRIPTIELGAERQPCSS